MNVLNCIMPCILGSILHLRLVSQGILFSIVLCSVFQSQLLGWEVGVGGRVGRDGGGRDREGRGRRSRVGRGGGGRGGGGRGGEGGKQGRGREGRRREGRGGGTLVNIMELLLQ